MKECPCGSNFPYTDCCGPLIRGTIPADTAEDLMRSRYTAFSKKEWGYIDQTQYADKDPDKPDSSYYRQENIEWTKLEILGSKNGGQSDKKGEVSFIAHYNENDEEKILQETSKFIKKDGRWYYDEENSKVAPTTSTSGKPFIRSQPKVGRNDPCICGSKKKYKKCCG